MRAFTVSAAEAHFAMSCPWASVVRQRHLCIMGVECVTRAEPIPTCREARIRSRAEYGGIKVVGPADLAIGIDAKEYSVLYPLLTGVRIDTIRKVGHFVLAACAFYRPLLTVGVCLGLLSLSRVHVVVLLYNHTCLGVTPHAFYSIALNCCCLAKPSTSLVLE